MFESMKGLEFGANFGGIISYMVILPTLSNEHHQHMMPVRYNLTGRIPKVG